MDAKVTAYVNGVEVHSEATPAAIAQGVGGFYIGNSPAYGGPAASFIVDDVVVYDRGLEEAEVVAIMDGDLLAVEATDKLASTWGDIKSLR
jgi:hypothetical protein